ncbi:MAG: hypothetical protein M5U09_09265 [Gammaproteobacteria bacterium]|nr:hypothetical protein [Gammaproteobacteria bacterium]
MPLEEVKGDDVSTSPARCPPVRPRNLHRRPCRAGSNHWHRPAAFPRPPPTGAGPEFLSDAPYTATFWREGDPGERLMLSGRIMDTSGRPVAGAVVELWQADGAGNYHDNAYRGRLVTDEGGRYAVRTVVPASYYRAKHIHMMVSHDSHGTVTTRVEFKGDPALEGRDDSHAVVLEETRVQDDVVYVGTFDVVLPGS